MNLIGYIVSVLSTILYSLTYPLQKKVGDDIPVFMLMTIVTVTVAVIAFFFSVIFEKGLHFNFVQHKSSILILILVGIVNVFAFWCLLLGYKYLPLWQEIMITMISPIFTAIFAYYILGESFSYKMFVGLFIMTIGLFVAIK